MEIEKKVLSYVTAHGGELDPVCREIYDFTMKNVHAPHMMIGEFEAQFLGFILKSISAKDVLEIGTYTGYSALNWAYHLPKNGQVTTLDRNKETMDIACSFWNKSLNGFKIKPVLGNALESLKSMDQKFDFIFIDADKRNYQNYLDLSLNLLNPNGIIAIDNVLWQGKVLDEVALTHDLFDKNAQYLRDFNRRLADRRDLYSTILPIRDGITLVKLIVD